MAKASLAKRKANPNSKCPYCGLPFSDWFFWPPHGNYCWPCYKKTGQIITKPEA